MSTHYTQVYPQALCMHLIFIAKHEIFIGNDLVKKAQQNKFTKAQAFNAYVDTLRTSLSTGRVHETQFRETDRLCTHTVDNSVGSMSKQQLNYCSFENVVRLRTF